MTVHALYFIVCQYCLRQCGGQDDMRGGADHARTRARELGWHLTIDPRINGGRTMVDCCDRCYGGKR
jgi:hypothetical protein